MTDTRSSSATRQTPPMLSPQATADRLDVSVKTIRRLIGRGDLIVHRIGRNLRISEADLQRYLRSCM